MKAVSSGGAIPSEINPQIGWWASRRSRQASTVSLEMQPGREDQECLAYMLAIPLPSRNRNFFISSTRNSQPWYTRASLAFCILSTTFLSSCCRSFDSVSSTAQPVKAAASPRLRIFCAHFRSLVRIPASSSIQPSQRSKAMA